MGIDDSKLFNSYRSGGLSAAEQLEQDIAEFNANPVSDISAAERARRYQERGAIIAMPHKVYCERVGRKVYFMDYTVGETDKNECIEGNPFIPKCPFAKQEKGRAVCEKYARYPFGRNKTVSIDTAKIKNKK